MKKNILSYSSIIVMMLLFLNCGNQKPPQQSTAGMGDWKLGIALWTFHTVNFPQSLSMVDSCNVRFIEPNEHGRHQKVRGSDRSASIHRRGDFPRIA